MTAFVSGFHPKGEGAAHLIGSPFGAPAAFNRRF